MYLFPTRSNLCKDYTLFYFCGYHQKIYPPVNNIWVLKTCYTIFQELSEPIHLRSPTNSISLDSDYKFFIEEFTENSFEEVQPELLKR